MVKIRLSVLDFFVCLFRTWAEHSQDHPIRMRGLRTAALMRHMGPAVPTSAVFCLQKSHACWVSACFRTPRLSLGHPGSFKSAHVLKCMRTQTAPLFNVPRGRRGTTTRVVHHMHTVYACMPAHFPVRDSNPGPLACEGELYHWATSPNIDFSPQDVPSKYA